MSDQAVSTYISRRRVGEAEITLVSEGSCLWAPRLPVPEPEWRRALPEADAQGRIPIGFTVAHISLGDASIIVDPGFDDPGSAWQERFDATFPSLVGLVRTPGLDAALAHLGVAPERITHVLITHAHADHFAGVTAEREGRQQARFPRARHLVGRADWEGNPRRAERTSDLAVRLAAIDDLGLLDLLDGEREVAPGITAVPSPGETPGHTIVRVRSGAASFYYLGDLFHHACEVEHPDWAPPGRDGTALHASRDALVAEAVASGALLVYSHGRFPGWGRIRRAAAGPRWEAAPG